MIAFWKYDLFPYLLHGKIDTTRTCAEGFVYVPSYRGVFRPEFVLPDEHGEVLAKSLDTLRRSYRDAKDKLHQDYMKQRESYIAVVLKYGDAP